MPYAVYADLVNRYGATEALAVADTEGVGAPNMTAVNLAAQNSTDEINSAVQVKYDLTAVVAQNPDIFLEWCVVLMHGRLAFRPGQAQTDAVKDEVAEVRRQLGLVAKGERKLAVVPDLPTKGKGVVLSTGRRRLSRRTLGGIL